MQGRNKFYPELIKVSPHSLSKTLAVSDLDIDTIQQDEFAESKYLQKGHDRLTQMKAEIFKKYVWCIYGFCALYCIIIFLFILAQGSPKCPFELDVSTINIIAGTVVAPITGLLVVMSKAVLNVSQ